jgi:peptidoglycan pentaglycine glycine transferase (the first glycine)
MESQIITTSEYDPSWDNFLENQPMGHYTQSSLWGLLKSMFGWQVHRILIKEEGAIIGGAQLLTRDLPVCGKIGYISKGPIINNNNPSVMAAIFDQIENLANKHRIFLVSIQPPYHEEEYTKNLKKYRFEPSCYYVIPPSTVIVDLSLSQDKILKQMKRTTRQNIRSAQSRGVIVKEGMEDDVPKFCALKQKTESRSDFVHYDQCYYEEAWRLFSPSNHMKLWLAYFGEDLLSGLVAIYFGHQVVYAWAGSSGIHTEKRPNDLLFWHAMIWGKEHGYNYCDLGGISPRVADALKMNQDAPDCKEKGIARYKMGFGSMHTFPPSFDKVYILKPKWLVRKAISIAWGKNRKAVSKLVRGVTN